MKKIVLLSIAVFSFATASYAAKSAKEYVADLKNSDDAVVLDAENWVGENKEKSAIKDLVSLLKNSTNSEIRANAAVALGLIGEKDGAIDGLTDAIANEPNADVRYAMLLAISRLGIDSKKSYNALMQAKEKETDPYIKDYIEKMEKKFANKD